ncbi:hypothetical protein BA187_11965 [Serratia marcescens]|nr:hypothetical protein BA187_11965 [Serratia marcescens]
MVYTCFDCRELISATEIFWLFIKIRCGWFLQVFHCRLALLIKQIYILAHFFPQFTIGIGGPFQTATARFDNVWIQASEVNQFHG